MKKMKRIFINFSLFLIGLISKVKAEVWSDMEKDVESFKQYYKDKSPSIPREPTVLNTNEIISIIIYIILFISSIIILLNKKITKRTKKITISSFILIAIIVCIINFYINIKMNSL